jgi:hypothetical protein
MDIVTRQTKPTTTPAVSVTVVFDQDPHKAAERDSLVAEVTKVVAQYSKHDKAKVRVDLQYGKSDMEIFREAFEDRVKGAEEEVAELDSVLRKMSPENDMGPLAIRRDQKHAELRLYSYIRMILPK